jgi:hypothetical protein
MGGVTFAVFAFNSVDCTMTCGNNAWREVHAVLWDRAGARAAFAIFYLDRSSTFVTVAYALTLPDLSDPTGATGQVQLEATWTAR